MLSESIQRAVSKILGLPLSYEFKLNFTLLTGDASERSYFRITSPKLDGRSYVLMKMKKGFNSPAEEITKTSRKIDELPFLNIHHFLKTSKAPVPEVFGFDSKEGIIVLEDLGDTSLFSSFGKLDKGNIQKIYERLILEMINFQTIIKPFSPCIAFYRKYDREMCIWELQHFIEWGVESFLNLKIPNSEKETIDVFFEKIINKFLSEKFYFSHRDYHSKNIMMTGGSFKIIDFQDALLAPPQYDLASLLRDSYVTIEDDIVESMLNLYISKFSEKMERALEPVHFRKTFDFVSIHRNLKAAGRFVFIEKKKGNSNYIRFIPRTLAYVKNNLNKYDEFKEVKPLLFKYIQMIEEKIAKFKKE